MATEKTEVELANGVIMRVVVAQRSREGHTVGGPDCWIVVGEEPTAPPHLIGYGRTRHEALESFTYLYDSFHVIPNNLHVRPLPCYTITELKIPCNVRPLPSGEFEASTDVVHRDINLVAFGNTIKAALLDLEKQALMVLGALEAPLRIHMVMVQITRTKRDYVEVFAIQLSENKWCAVTARTEMQHPDAPAISVSGETRTQVLNRFKAECNRRAQDKP